MRGRVWCIEWVCDRSRRVATLKPECRNFEEALTELKDLKLDHEGIAFEQESRFLFLPKKYFKHPLDAFLTKLQGNDRHLGTKERACECCCSFG